MEDLNQEEILQGIKDTLDLMGENEYWQALIVIVCSIAAARMVDVFLTRVVVGLARRTRSDLDDRLIQLAHRPVFNTVLFIGLYVALRILNEDEWIRDAGTNLIKTLIILFWVVFGVRATRVMLNFMAKDEKRFGMIQTATQPLFEIALKLTLFAVAIYFILISWGINPVGWLASAGIVAVAVGLAAQDALGNLFAGISILADTPYKIGDYIVLDGNERGKVTKIGLRSTRILTRDDIEIIVPNTLIANSKIVNESGGPSIKQRMRIPVGVAYGSDSDRVKEVLLNVIKENSYICSTPEPWVRFNEFGDSSLNFEIRCWVSDPALRGRALDSINSGIYRELRAAGIEIPFPKRDIYIKELPSNLVKGAPPRKERE